MTRPGSLRFIVSIHLGLTLSGPGGGAGGAQIACGKERRGSATLVFEREPRETTASGKRTVMGPAV